MKGVHTNPNKIYVVVPAKDEGKYIDGLLSQLTNLGFQQIVLVNDHSQDETKELAEVYPNCTVLHHVINLGAGAATQTGIAFAVSQEAEIICTIDADLQHNPEDLLRLIRHLENKKGDLVIGSRFMKRNDIPTSRIFYNKVANLISLFLTGRNLTDSQSGLKVISGRLGKRLDLKYDGFEFCMEIIKQANASGANISEVPIEVTYNEDTKHKGQNIWSGIRIVSKLISPFS